MLHPHLRGDLNPERAAIKCPCGRVLLLPVLCLIVLRGIQKAVSPGRSQLFQKWKGYDR